MARVKGGMSARRKHNKVLKLAKGYRGARSKQYRVAKQSVMRALTSSYAGRKERKRQMRQLWIARINAAARLNGLSYSKFMFSIHDAPQDTGDIRLERKTEQRRMSVILDFGPSRAASMRRPARNQARASPSRRRTQEAAERRTHSSRIGCTGMRPGRASR